MTEETKETTNGAADTVNKETLVIRDQETNDEYEFIYPEGVTYARMANMLIQLRDHVVYTARMIATQEEINKVKEEKAEAESN